MAQQTEASDILWKLRGVDFQYHGSSTKVLRSIDLELSRGRIYGILGPNGSGKTTLLDLLCGLNTPCTGIVKFRGLPLQDYSTGKLARKIAVMPQEFHMRFAFTVREAVEMGCHPHIPRFSRLPEELDALVHEVMEQLDIAALSGRPVTMLSGGEKQRVAAARALVQSRDALLLDEATSNLDIFHSLSILEVIRERARKQRLAVAAAVHDINLALSFCDEFIFLHNGIIAAKGPPEETLEEKLLQKIYGVETRVRYDDFTKRSAVSFRIPPCAETGTT